MTRKEYQQLPALNAGDEAKFMDARSEYLKDHPWMQEIGFSIGTDNHQDYLVCCRRFARAYGLRLCSLDDYRAVRIVDTKKWMLAKLKLGIL